MKQGRSSRTAELVCMGRALAHERGSVPAFSDPTAMTLLPDAARARVQSLSRGETPTGLRDWMRRHYFDVQSKMMIARTVFIDDAIRGAAAPQVVILGAGLDGRAFRMPELRDVVVFEVDHPDSQRDKRERAARLTPIATDLRFVPVDFQKGTLDDALASAGHDPLRPTTWVWEGVVMYLTPRDVESTLAVIERRSASGSRLLIVYLTPALIAGLVAIVLGRIGEPLRSTFEPKAMRALVASHGFDVVRDDDIHSVGASLSADIGAATKMLVHQRMVTADRCARE